MGNAYPLGHIGTMEGLHLPICMALCRDASSTQVDGGGPPLLEDPVWQSHWAQLSWPCLKKGKGPSFTGMCL